jgi:hypothetical protein
VKPAIPSADCLDATNRARFNDYNYAFTGIQGQSGTQAHSSAFMRMAMLQQLVLLACAWRCCGHELGPANKLAACACVHITCTPVAYLVFYLLANTMSLLFCCSGVGEEPGQGGLGGSR